MIDFNFWSGFGKFSVFCLFLHWRQIISHEIIHKHFSDSDSFYWMILFVPDKVEAKALKTFLLPKLSTRKYLMTDCFKIIWYDSYETYGMLHTYNEDENADRHGKWTFFHVIIQLLLEGIECWENPWTSCLLWHVTQEFMSRI